MRFLSEIAERRISEAMQQGKFDNLAYKGKPLPMENLSQVPEQLRVGYKILKNAGVLPPEMELRKEMVTLRDLIDSCLDESLQRSLKERLQQKLLRYRVMMENRRR